MVQYTWFTGSFFFFLAGVDGVAWNKRSESVGPSQRANDKMHASLTQASEGGKMARVAVQIEPKAPSIHIYSR